MEMPSSELAAFPLGLFSGRDENQKFLYDSDCIARSRSDRSAATWLESTKEFDSEQDPFAEQSRELLRRFFAKQYNNITTYCSFHILMFSFLSVFSWSSFLDPFCPQRKFQSGLNEFNERCPLRLP
jgi:hypothetical protein